MLTLIIFFFAVFFFGFVIKALMIYLIEPSTQPDPEDIEAHSDLEYYFISSLYPKGMTTKNTFSYIFL